MNAHGARPYCKKPMACIARARGRCRLCHYSKTRRTEEMIAFHNKGAKTLREVGERFGVCYQRVWEILRCAGILERKQPKRSHADLSAAQRRKHHALCVRGIPAAVAHNIVRGYRAAEHALDQK